mmetsp:Transcript_45132/g.130315  ORF Transcript_45132/g.130315 Transcript_45132/m.130315 type:complete len:216 (-) Transcript_45132:124-771(-)|eukprot:CAMPEP_0176058728 /NCGR_PEP_ID=MMETSP0120_2-20121206/29263_1 /TAXON_ID=160619 /ORGANISM="Kryptoperidinium foliaceum, Strain CCMP 1326" /LENGTH=215 /DNA_ID=CAMNT_0017392259 /DNA_START=47 /DNA_END=694 /DNA_ORIENTATION=+
MKFSYSFFVASLVASASGFSASPPSKNTRPDASAAVEEALKITATYGIDSNEARIAWETVEEMDAADFSEATKGSSMDECDVEAPTQECKDYGQFLDELKNIQDMMAQKDEEKKKLKFVDVLKNVKLTSAKPSKARHSPELEAALEAAKKATAEFGATSKEARLAWEDYEEIASSGRLDNAMGVCSDSAGEDAAKAIAELDRVMGVLMAAKKDEE